MPRTGCDHEKGYCRTVYDLPCNEVESAPIIRAALEDAVTLLKDEREHSGWHGPFAFSCVEGSLRRALTYLPKEGA